MKPIIEDIISSEEFNSAYKAATNRDKHRVMHKYLGGDCTYCGKIPTKLLKYDLEGYGSRIERVCHECYQKWIVDNKDAVKLLDTGQRNATIVQRVCTDNE